MPYTENQIAALDRDNFDFDAFDWRRARRDLRRATTEGSSWRTRFVHVAYSLAKGRPIVGPRGIEQIATRQPVRASDVESVLHEYEEVADVAPLG